MLTEQGRGAVNQGDSAYDGKHWGSFHAPTGRFAETSGATDGFDANIHMIADSRPPWSSSAPIPVDEYTQMQADSQGPSDGVHPADALWGIIDPMVYDQRLLLPQQAPYIGSEGPVSSLGYWNSSAVPSPLGMIGPSADHGTVDPRALDLHSRGCTS